MMTKLGVEGHCQCITDKKRVRLVILFSIAMIALASAANAMMDTLSFRFEKSVFAKFEAQRSWLDPKLSWRNKWKNGDPNQGEAFIMSSTSLVSLTDAWHFLKAGTILFVLLAILAPFTLIFKMRWFAWCGILLLLKILYGIVFESFFAFLLVR